MKDKKTVIQAVLLIAALMLISCSKEGAKGSESVVKINGKSITSEDVQFEIKNLPDMARSFFQGKDGSDRFVDELVKKEVLYLEAQNKGLHKTKDFEKKVEEFKKITLINQLLQKEAESAPKITEEEAKGFYEKNTAEFTVNERIRLSHILLKNEADIEKVYERLKTGEDFGRVAADLSLDKESAKQGGDIGNFKRGEMRPEIEEAAFRLKKGDISMPIRLKDGIHIVKVTDSKGSVMPFDKIKNIVMQRLAIDKQRQGFDKLVEDLKKKYKIEINKEAVQKLTFEQPAAPVSKEKK